MIIKIKNGWIQTGDYGLTPSRRYRIEEVSIDALLKERRILHAVSLEFTKDTPDEVRQGHRELDDQLARLIDSKCKESKTSC